MIMTFFLVSQDDIIIFIIISILFNYTVMGRVDSNTNLGFHPRSS